MPSEPSGTAPESPLHAAYSSLLARAAEAGWIDPGGMTPPEQCAAIAGHKDVPAGERAGWLRLERLLDECVYADRATLESVREALQLCGERLRFFAGRPAPAPPMGAPRRMAGAGVLRFAVTGVLVVAALGLGVLFAPRVLKAADGLFAGGRPAVAGNAWSDRLKWEREALFGLSKGWSAPAAQATMVEMKIDPVARPRGKGDRGLLDLDTGRDGTFPGAADPFRPPLDWTHRHRIDIGINSKYELIGASPAGGRAYDPAATGGFRHHVTTRVELRPGVPVSIPTSAPGATVWDWNTSSGIPLKFTRDSGDGLCVAGDAWRDIDLSYDLVAGVDYWNAPIPDTPFTPAATSLPDNIRRDAAEVLRRVGGIPGATFRGTVRRLHAYCAGFVVAPIKPSERRANDFLTLALARKGVCRHRALVFFVLANAAGVRTRLVSNKVHAFCEIQLPDGTWRRMEFRLEDAPGGPWPAELPPGWWASPLLGVASISAIALFIVGLVLIGLVGAHLDRTLHRLPRTGEELHEARGIRDDRLQAFGQIRALVAVVSGEAAASGDNLAQMVQLRRRLEGFAASEANDVDVSELQRVHWDCRFVLRWLRRTRGDHGV